MEEALQLQAEEAEPEKYCVIESTSTVHVYCPPYNP